MGKRNKPRSGPMQSLQKSARIKGWDDKVPMPLPVAARNTDVDADSNADVDVDYADLPTDMVLDLRVGHGGRASLYVTSEQAEVLAPEGPLFWSMQENRIWLAAKYRPDTSTEVRTHGVVRPDKKAKGIAFSMSCQQFTHMPRGRRLLVMVRDGYMFKSRDCVQDIVIAGSMGTPYGSPDVHLIANLPPSSIETVDPDLVHDLPPFDDFVRLPGREDSTYSGHQKEPVEKRLRQLRRLVDNFNHDYGKLAAQMKSIQPALSLDGSQIRAHINVTV